MLRTCAIRLSRILCESFHSNKRNADRAFAPAAVCSNKLFQLVDEWLRSVYVLIRSHSYCFLVYDAYLKRHYHVFILSREQLKKREIN